MKTPHSPFARFLLGLLVCATGLAVANVRAQTAPAMAADEKKAIIYKISRTDKVTIVVVGEPDLNVAGKRVDANGNVGLNIIGDVKIAGLSVGQAQKAIEDAYINGRILRTPQVSITIEDYAPRTVLVSGMVKQPGTVNLPPETTMNMKELIQKVGGFSETANGKKVTVTRVLPDGTTKMFTLDVASTLRGRDTGNSADATFVLEPDDIVYVPEKLI